MSLLIIAEALFLITDQVDVGPILRWKKEYPEYP